MKKPKKKSDHFLLILLSIILLLAIIGWAVATVIVPVFSEDNPKVSQKIFALMNNDRQLYNVPNAQWDYNLANQALQRSVDLFISSNSPYQSNPYDREDAFVISKFDWTRSYYFSPEYVLDSWRNGDNNFRQDLLNRDYSLVGVGVSSDWNNYYVVIKWQ